MIIVKLCPRKIKDKIYTDVMRKPDRVSAFLKTIRGSGIGDIAGFVTVYLILMISMNIIIRSYVAGYNFEKDSFYLSL